REHACGKCGSCQERLEAFALNHTSDPLVYE
ncbi:7-cyano-7-deazaguanine synthase, partial [Alishewanella sp. SMS9]|nr:7-cyano-7-deazaguanine synthase [Alishewanella sp. SMS9]